MTKINPAVAGLKIIVIVGPTASGKSNLGIFLAQKFNGEIISADSRQVYKGMDVGTGKVLRDKTFPVPNSKFKNQNAKFRNYFYSSGIRHYLIDVASPKKQFTADDFRRLGQKAIADILSRGKIPIVVGGTGFYIDILLGRMSIAEVPPNPKLRKRFDKLTVERLFKMLKKLDLRRARTIDPKNKVRLIRALEIILTTKKKIPFLATNYPLLATNYDILWLGLKPKNLDKRIKSRLEKRLRQGMVKEVKDLLRSGVSKKRLYDFGLEYRWIARYLNGGVSYKKMKEGLLRDIIKYSKRQMTWFKRNKDIHWTKTQREAEKLLQSFL